MSLSGLFGVWASCRRELFEGVASVSGSFWYDGFTEWMAGHHSTVSRFYFSLGEKEKDGKNPRLAAVQEETDKVIAMLKADGKEGWELVGLAPYAMEVSNEVNESGIPIPGTAKGNFSWVAAAFKREIIED